MDILGQYVRTQRARKIHQCDWGHHDIVPSEVYFVGVTLPGSSEYKVSYGDYETVDWPFTVIKCCIACYNRERNDDYYLKEE